MIRTLLITFLLMPSSQIFAEEQPVISWLISSDKRISGTSELVQLKDGKIEKKIPVGRHVAYQYSNSRVAVTGWMDQKQILRTWDIKTGKELTRCERIDVSFPGSVLKSGAPSPMNGKIIEEHDQFIYSLHEYKNIDILTDSKYPNQHMCVKQQYYVVDLNTGKMMAKEETDFEKLNFQRYSPYPTAIKDHIGFSLGNGLFLEYLPKESRFDRKVLPGIINKSVNYLDGFGLTVHSVKGINLITDNKLRPLPKQKTIPFPDYPGLRISDLKSSKDQIVVTLITKRDSLNQKEENPVTTVVLYDMIQKKELFKKEFPLKVYDVSLSENLENFYMSDPQNKQAYHYNRPTGKLLKIDYSWSPYARFIPCFPKPDP